MDMDPQLAREWIDAARSLQSTMERFPQRRATDHVPNVAAQTGNISFNVDESKTQRMLWLSVFSVVLCALMSLITIAALIGGGMLYLNMKDHVDAIYMMAPQLNQPKGKSP